MTNDDPAALDPTWQRTLVGHVELAGGDEIVTVHVRDDASVVVALYAMPDEETEPADADTTMPAPVMLLSPDECAELAGWLIDAALRAKNQRRLRLVHNTDDDAEAGA